MSQFAAVVLEWAPHIIRALPYIMSSIKGLVDVWNSLSKTKEEDSTVLKAMRLLDRHQNDLERLLDNRQEREELLAGLTIIMTKIGNIDKPPSAPSFCNSKYPESCENVDGSLCCGVCKEPFNTSDRRPLLMPKCGHTFCKLCLTELDRRMSLRCPICRCDQDVDLYRLPTNVVLLGLLEKQEDDDCCGKGKNSSMSLSYEEQIKYALYLSEQDIPPQPKETDGACFMEKEEEEDNEAKSLSLAWALLEEDVLMASKCQWDKNQCESSFSPEEKSTSVWQDTAHETVCKEPNINDDISDDKEGSKLSGVQERETLGAENTNDQYLLKNWPKWGQTVDRQTSHKPDNLDSLFTSRDSKKSLNVYREDSYDKSNSKKNMDEDSDSDEFHLGKKPNPSPLTVRERDNIDHVKMSMSLTEEEQLEIALALSLSFDDNKSDKEQ